MNGLMIFLPCLRPIIQCLFTGEDPGYVKRGGGPRSKRGGRVADTAPPKK